MIRTIKTHLSPWSTLICALLFGSTTVFAASTNPDVKPVAEVSGPPYPLVSFDDGIHFSTPDGEQYASIHGQFAMNHSRFNGAYNVDELGDGRFGQDSRLQTARLNLSGRFSPDWNYKMELATRGGFDDDVYLRQAYMAYSGIPVVTITLGKFAMNYGLDNMHDTYDTYGTGFSMLSGTFTPPAALGITLSHYYPSNGITWNAGVYSFGDVIRNSDSEFGGQPGFLEDTAAYIGRLGWTLYDNETTHHVLFAEVSGFYLEGSGNAVVPLEANGNVLGTIAPNKIPPFSSGPVAFGANQKHSSGVDVGMGAELNSFSFESEFTQARTLITGTVHDRPIYSDGYIQAGWVITGEHRNYDASDAYLVTITPDHRYGAFELIARYEGIQLQSNIGPEDTHTGNNGRTVTAGIDWYLNNHTRFAMDASHMWTWGPYVRTKEGNGVVFQGAFFF